MANAKPVEVGTKANGKNIKEQVLGAAAAIKAKLDTGPKAPPVNLKPTMAKAPEQPEPEAAHDTEPLTWRQMLADMGINVPGWKRTLIAYAASFLSGYVVGVTFSALFDYMFAASIAVSGWTFMTIVAYVIGLVIAVYAAVKLGQKVGGYILTGNIDDDAKRLWSRVTQTFSTGKLQTV